jgi:hypothetical protein
MTMVKPASPDSWPTWPRYSGRSAMSSAQWRGIGSGIGQGWTICVPWRPLRRKAPWSWAGPKRAGLAIDGEFRCIALTVHSSLDAVGLTAVVAKALADAAIPANVKYRNWWFFRYYNERIPR